MSTPNSAHIVAAYSKINDVVSMDKKMLTHYNSQIEKLAALNISPTILTIDPLSTPWFSEQKPLHFRSGCAPIMALETAVSLLKNTTDAVIIQANEPLKTGYSREERHQLMAIYDENITISDLYQQLADEFIAQQSLTNDEFKQLCDRLFVNYKASYQQLINTNQAHFSLPSTQWFAPVTELFRGVDCANPLVDFSGKILICNDKVLDLLECKQSISVSGVNCQELPLQDETTSIDKIVQYQHLQQAYLHATKQANIDFNTQYQQGNALLEVYTCYPVVPMAFLLTNGFVHHCHELPEWLENNSITVTGGMNLARAPWNAPSLNALIAMTYQLNHSSKSYGLVHGNGGLGYRQGVAILAKNS